MIGLPVSTGNSLLNKIRDLIDAATGAGTMVLYTGLRQHPDTPTTVNVAVATLAFQTTSAPNASGLVLTFNAIAPVTASATGTATWARIFDGDGNKVLDVDVGTLNDDVEVQVDDPDLVAGDPVTVVSMQISVEP